MRIVRFKRDPNELPVWGWMADDRIGVLDGSPFDEFQREEARLPLEEAQLVSPVIPGKIICVGLNYAAHAAEHDAEVPELPLIFLKPPSTVIGPGQTILLPPQSQQVEHEAELAVIISQRGRWIRPEQVTNYVLGFTVANDVTARDLQFRDGQWTRSKGFDTFCPLGPWIKTEFEPADALITCSVNGQMRQMASTRDMIFTVPHIVAFISSVMTLEPGDVILTGTPPGVGPIVDGDEVTVEIEGLGILHNPVKADLRGK
ncbi:MAG TPA: fumarylacetoacetate hydrolase family protein [Anaerolineae bacterium]|nr:fumarylacetoacetate hydrolase family protein [Anaerolineae bacterium]